MTSQPKSRGSPSLSAFELINNQAFSYYRRLGKVRDYVLRHYSEPITLAQAARTAGMADKYFSTFFHHKTGIRFRDWVAQIRVAKAMGLMRRRNWSITQTGFEVGFQDLRTFERTFKKFTGITPRDFKMAVRPG